MTEQLVNVDQSPLLSKLKEEAENEIEPVEKKQGMNLWREVMHKTGVRKETDGEKKEQKLENERDERIGQKVITKFFEKVKEEPMYQRVDDIKNSELDTNLEYYKGNRYQITFLGRFIKKRKEDGYTMTDFTNRKVIVDTFEFEHGEVTFYNQDDLNYDLYSANNNQSVNGGKKRKTRRNRKSSKSIKRKQTKRKMNNKKKTNKKKINKKKRSTRKR
jgi:hypothetical protein